MQQQDGVRNIAWSARAGSSRHASPVTPLWQARSCRIPTFMKVSVLSSTAIAAAWIAGSLGAQEPDTAPKPAATLRSIEAQLKSKAEEEARLIEEAAARAREIQSLRYRLIETANTIQDSEREIARIETELVRLSAEEMDAEADLRAEQATLSEVLAALQAFELSQPPALLVSPDDANEAARAALLLSEAAPALAEKASRLRETVERLSAARDALARERQNYVDTANALAARRQVLAEDLAGAITERERKEAARADLADRVDQLITDLETDANATSLNGSPRQRRRKRRSLPRGPPRSRVLSTGCNGFPIRSPRESSRRANHHHPKWRPGPGPGPGSRLFQNQNRTRRQHSPPRQTARPSPARPGQRPTSLPDPLPRPKAPCARPSWATW